MPSEPSDDLAAALAAAFGDEATLTEEFGDRTIDVPVSRWGEAARWARDEQGYGFFDWLTAVDEEEAGFSVVLGLWRLPSGEQATGQSRAQVVMLRTRVARDQPSVPTLTGVFAGASWAERETAEMFGLDFPGHPHLVTLLLPEGFEGHPLRKEFVLAARVSRPWPGAKEPGESDADLAGGESADAAAVRPGRTGTARPSRRRNLPPGLPDPSWGPRPPE